MFNLIGRVMAQEAIFERRGGVAAVYRIKVLVQGRSRILRIYMMRLIAKKAMALLRFGAMVEFEGVIDSNRFGEKIWLVAQNFSVLESGEGKLLTSTVERVPRTKEKIINLVTRGEPTQRRRDELRRIKKKALVVFDEDKAP